MFRPHPTCHLRAIRGLPAPTKANFFTNRINFDPPPLASLSITTTTAARPAPVPVHHQSLSLLQPPSPPPRRPSERIHHRHHTHLSLYHPTLATMSAPRTSDAVALALVVPAMVDTIDKDVFTTGRNRTKGFPLLQMAEDAAWGLLHTDADSCANGERSGIDLGRLVFRHALQAPLERVCCGCSASERRVLTEALMSPQVILSLLRSSTRRNPHPSNHPLKKDNMLSHVDNFFAIVGMLIERDVDDEAERVLERSMEWAFPILEVGARAFSERAALGGF
ncbi:hypothetical protein B0H17DRAFT_1213050 [Mycena rosella]|uniref:Uncharacterized protein n=1 Tax=Mycena rosella TaxID=1033263 RepID=A0AAD7CR03_MYCRO|nr:hypothetical protein B0H17DRAFT_1213050 [Mycena rosella]